MMIIGFTLTIFFILGAILASGAGAFAYRLKFNKPLFFDRSECESCHKKLESAELIPIISYFLLKGRCKKCKKKISVFNPLAEIGFGIYAAFLGQLTLAPGLDTLEVVLYLLFGFGIFVIIISDFLYLEIPNEMQVFLLILAIARIILIGTNPISAILSALLAAAFFFAVFKFTGENKMGFGDVKLAFVLGLFFTLFQFLVIVTLASFLGVLLGLLMAQIQKVEINKVKVPFGSMLGIIALAILIISFLSFAPEYLGNYDIFEYFI